MRYFVEISVAGNGYRGAIHPGNPAAAHNVPDLKLAPTDTVTIRGQTYSWNSLLQTLVAYQPQALADLFDERGQLEIGQQLYRQTLGQLPEAERRRLHDPNTAVDIRIVTHDEHIARLPWVLLAYNGLFLAATGWSIALAGKTDLIDCELPPSPRILVIAPEPLQTPPTYADLHLETLEQELVAHDHRLTWGRHLQRVATWADFSEQVKTFAPQIIYYYGHGEGDSQRARLLFADEVDQSRHPVPVADFALQLRNLPTPPLLVYVNCCLGDAAGNLGVGRQLTDFVPAVITNRTLASTSAAQAQALALWKSVLLAGETPQRAVANLYRGLIDLRLTTADVRWLTPVLHCHYDRWQANPPTPPSRLVHDPHWHLKIDRVIQFSVVAEQTRQMLRERKPRSHAFVWYGREGEGIEIFHQRLNIELRASLGNVYLDEVRPEWPMEFANFHRSCQDMLCEAFEVSELAAIPARIRAKTAGAFGQQTLVYVRHQPVRSPKVLDADKFQRYTEWWDNVFAPLLEPHQFALLGVSFLVNDPVKFQARMERIEDLDLHLTAVRLLDEMEKLALKDLRDFLRKHNLRFPLERRDQVLSKILTKTGGRYEQTVEELKNLVNLAWDLDDETAAAPKVEKEEDDW